MVDILFIKTSSLGDVVHHMPAVTDARRRLPKARLVWVVEEAFAPLVGLHPGVDAIVPVAWRRWRKRLGQGETWREIAGFSRRLRAEQYDAVVDTQGLMRTAVITRLARGVRHGYDTGSIKERLASAAYDVRHAVSRDLHAVERNRRLTALALGYEIAGDADYGLDRATLADSSAATLASATLAVPARGGPYAVLLHATARPEKEWPEADWVALGKTLSARGIALVLPWGTPREKERAERLAGALPGATVPDRKPLDEVARLIAGASLVVGVDTGLLHLAAALGVPLVSIFVGSRPTLTGPTGSGPIATLGGHGERCPLGDVLGAVERVLPA
ncbi:Lipopolysaccharide heptosyltransferase I [Rhodovulum sp. PH10]|uniref:lipopolysaccharide heptosyltransferase I n=1 Tax=Rhodovulum sp. PH10 TaxID=1187851 RepID=UPI00027C257E|nr:lipopolysaccharide heptosyltransferase I [Rhodovulum sp. PH10]EJW10237.1 Lipopolysaccharide heptosyltransferase I [Rhodovulum sp. PH10]